MKLIDSIQKVKCAETVVLLGRSSEWGCGWEGSVEIVGVPRTDETLWVCPSCRFEHIGLAS